MCILKVRTCQVKATPIRGPVGGEQDSVILAELRKLRQEHTKAAKDNKNKTKQKLVKRTTSLEQRTVDMEERLGSAA